MRGPGAIVIAVMFVGGCYPAITVTRTGRPYPPKPPSCELAFDYVDQQSAMKVVVGYLPIATMSLPSQPDEFRWDDVTKDKLRVEACRVGGDLVAFQGAQPATGDALRQVTSGGNWGNFVVFRKREAPLLPQ